MRIERKVNSPFNIYKYGLREGKSIRDTDIASQFHFCVISVSVSVCLCMIS